MRKIAAVLAALIAVGLAPTLSNANHCVARQYMTMRSDLPPDSVFQALWADNIGGAGCRGETEIADTNYFNPGSTVLEVLVLKPAANVEKAKPTGGTVTFNTSPATTKNLVFTWDTACNCWRSQTVTIPSSATTAVGRACVVDEEDFVGCANRSITYKKSF